MGIEKTLGGNRLGSGNKMKIELHNYERSTFNQSRKWLSSMTTGTLVPCFKEIGTNGDKFEIEIKAAIRTVPTVLPLFGSFKFQCDFFAVPMRLYNGILHNNAINIGMNMDKVLFPKIEVPIQTKRFVEYSKSSLMNYLNLRGEMWGDWDIDPEKRKVYYNAIPVLSYYDIFKNYYANKQEEKAYVIKHNNDKDEKINMISGLYLINRSEKGVGIGISYIPDEGDRLLFKGEIAKVITGSEDYEKVEKGKWNAGDWWLVYPYPIKDFVGIRDTKFQPIIMANEMTKPERITFDNQTSFGWKIDIENRSKAAEVFNELLSSYQNAENAGYIITDTDVDIQEFELENIDKIKYKILKATGLNETITIGIDKEVTELPYGALIARGDTTGDYTDPNEFELNGLVLKTYQSDIYNNWMSENFSANIDYIKQVSAINIEAANGTLQMDALNMAQKVYNMLNRIAASGSSWNDWQEAVYTESSLKRAESPIYVGGYSCDIVFEELISSVEATTSNGEVIPQGNLVGKGISINEKGGKVIINCDEPTIIIAIASITPRIAYERNSWFFNHLQNFDQLHKPALDGIGYQPALFGEKDFMANYVANGNTLNSNFKGYVPAWIHYMTAVDEVYGDFANSKLNAMTLTKKYKVSQYKGSENRQFVTIDNDTTYVNPNEYNYAFADNSSTAQNFWVQIGFNVESRRKMSAKQIPNL